MGGAQTRNNKDYAYNFVSSDHCTEGRVADLIVGGCWSNGWGLMIQLFGGNDSMVGGWFYNHCLYS